MSEKASNLDIKLIELACRITVAWLGNPNVVPSADETTNFFSTVRTSIEQMRCGTAKNSAAASSVFQPAVPIESSIKADYIVSLINGKKLKSLKRHLSAHGLTPKQYRERYGLRPDYPMVAENYSARRRVLAKQLGLRRGSATSVVISSLDKH